MEYSAKAILIWRSINNMVYFVGAGSGAADLITIRGAELLKRADVVIYAGSLVNRELLDFCSKNCKIYNSAYMNLDDIERVYIENKELLIIRLHTGDPCLYGAVKEQMDILDKNGIAYEYCPGVSSFCGAAAALKLEYTLPSVSQSVIITRAEGRTGMPKSESIASFAAHNSTMVIFLSASLTDKLQKELIKGGYAEDTPCAIVYKATWKEEKVFRCRLKKLNETAQNNNITKTAIIVVGNVLDSGYEPSKLYDKDFKTEYRK